jgi:hypothetical protein
MKPSATMIALRTLMHVLVTGSLIYVNTTIIVSIWASGGAWKPTLALVIVDGLLVAVLASEAVRVGRRLRKMQTWND